MADTWSATDALSHSLGPRDDGVGARASLPLVKHGACPAGSCVPSPRFFPLTYSLPSPRVRTRVSAASGGLTVHALAI